ncbi:hypothetical protein JCM3770_001120 [Rhodotorula araucariae]
MVRPNVPARVVRNLMQRLHKTHCGCPMCSTGAQAAANSPLDIVNAANALRSGGRNSVLRRAPAPLARGYATPVDAPQGDYAFEVAASNLRFGEGVTREVGMDFANQKARKVGVFTDKTVGKLLPMQMALESLDANNVKYEVFDRTRVEPNQQSWEDAIAFAKEHHFSHFLAVGGGSVIDTCKVANLFTVYPDADLYDFINAPIGKGKPIEKTLRPLIAVPTTAGTGSETTGTAIADLPHLSAKTGIASRAMRPLLGIVDPLNTDSCSREVHISSGLDVLFHALESWTAIPYTDRVPRPSNPILRPAYQGRNPISDVFSEWALRQTIKYLPRVARDGNDREAKTNMLLASTFAGIGFGNAGVHLAHGISYPVSGLNKKKGNWKHPGYDVDHPIVPHGISVALAGPSIFRFTAPTDPDRHRQVATIFEELAEPHAKDHIDTARVSDADLGDLLFDRIARFLVNLDVPRGLGAIGYTTADIPELVQGTLPQRRVLDLAPGFHGSEGKEELAHIIEGAKLVTHLLSPASASHRAPPSTRRLVSPHLIVSLPLLPQHEPALHTHEDSAVRDERAVASQRALALFRLPTLSVSLLPYVRWTPRISRIQETTLAVAVPEHHHHDRKGKGKVSEEDERVEVVEKWSAEIEWTLSVSTAFGQRDPQSGAAMPWIASVTKPRKVDLVFTSRAAPAASDKPRGAEHRHSGPPWIVHGYDGASSSSDAGGDSEVGPVSSARLVEKVSAEEHALELSFFRYALPPSPFSSLSRARDALVALLAVLAGWALPFAWALVRFGGLDTLLALGIDAAQRPHKRRAGSGEGVSPRGPTKRRKHRAGSTASGGGVPLASQFASTDVPGEGATLSALVGGGGWGGSGSEGHLRRHRRWSASTAASSTASSATLTPGSTPVALPTESTLVSETAGLGRAFLSTAHGALRDVGDLLWTIRQAVLFVTELVQEGWGVAKEVLVGGSSNDSKGEDSGSEGSDAGSSGGKSPRSAMSGGNGSRTHMALHKRVSFSSSSQVITASSPTSSGTATPTPASYGPLDRPAAAIHGLASAQAAAEARERASEFAEVYGGTHGAPREALSDERRAVGAEAAHVAREAAPLFAYEYTVATSEPDEALVGPHVRAGRGAAEMGRRKSGSEDEQRAIEALDAEIEAKRRAALASVQAHAAEVPGSEEQDAAHRVAAVAAAEKGRRISGTAAELAALAGVDRAQAARTHGTWLRLQDEALAARVAPATPAVPSVHARATGTQQHLHPASAVPQHLTGVIAGDDGGSETPTAAGSSGRLSPFSGLAAASGEAAGHVPAASLAEKLHALVPEQHGPRERRREMPGKAESLGGVQRESSAGQGRTYSHEHEVAGSTTDTSASAPSLEAKVRYASLREAAGGIRPPIPAPQKLDIEQVPTPPVPALASARSNRSRLPPSALEREQGRARVQAEGPEENKREETSNRRWTGTGETQQAGGEMAAEAQYTPSRAGTESDVLAYYTPQEGSPEPSLRFESALASPSLSAPGAHSPALHPLDAQSVFAPVFRPAVEQPRTPLQPVQPVGFGDGGAGSSPESSPSSGTAGRALPSELEREVAAEAGGASRKKRSRKKKKKGGKGAGGEAPYNPLPTPATITLQTRRSFNSLASESAKSAHPALHIDVDAVNTSVSPPASSAAAPTSHLRAAHARTMSDPDAKVVEVTQAEGADTYGSVNQHPKAESQETPFKVGVSVDRNKKCRRTMEDAHSFIYDFGGIRGQGYFAVFDGHAGKHAAEWCGHHFHEHLLDNLRKAPSMAIPDLLNATFHTVDTKLSELAAQGGTHSGCTAVTCFLRLEDDDGRPAGDASGVSGDVVEVKEGEDVVADHEGALRAAQAGGTPQINDQTVQGLAELRRDGDGSGSNTPASSGSGGGKSASDVKNRIKNLLTGKTDEFRAALGSGSDELSASASGTSATTIKTPTVEIAGPAVTKKAAKRTLYTANVGDARAVLSRAGKAVRLTYDHKGSDAKEAKRISDAGGFVLNNRVNGVLAVTRSLGDSSMKEFVVGAPFTTETTLGPEDEWLIVACDGLWDVCTDQEAVDLIKDVADPQEASQKLLDHALSSFSTDNLSILTVRLNNS